MYTFFGNGYMTMRIDDLKAQITRAATDTNEKALAQAVCGRLEQGSSVVTAKEVEQHASRIINDADPSIRMNPTILHPKTISFFKRLERKRVGKFILGRRDGKTRLEFSEVLDANAASKPIGASIRTEQVRDMVDYTFPLREGVTVRFQLPMDFRKNEAARLSDFIKSLPLE